MVPLTIFSDTDSYLIVTRKEKEKVAINTTFLSSTS